MTTPKRKVVKLARSDAGPKTKTAPVTKRLTIELSAQLHADLTALAETQRRELKQQILTILEAAVKAAKGQKRAKERKEAYKRRWYGEDV